MQIVCPNCATSYEVNAASLGAEGRSVRCARCQTVWLATAAPVPAMAGAEGMPTPDADAGAAGTETDIAADVQPVPESPAAHDNPQPFAADAAPDTSTAAIDGEIVEDAPPLAPNLPDGRPAHAGQAAKPPDQSGDIESVAARLAPPDARQRRRYLPVLNTSTVIVILAALASVLIGWRNDVVRVLPQTASFYGLFGLNVNLRGLAFVDIKTAREQHDSVNVLVVEGKIVSRVPKPIEVPRLRFAVRNDAGQEIYTWTALPNQIMLQPGAELPFRSRLASPPPDTRAVLVRFFHRRDIVAGSR